MPWKLKFKLVKIGSRARYFENSKNLINCRLSSYIYVFVVFIGEEGTVGSV